MPTQRLLQMGIGSVFALAVASLLLGCGIKTNTLKDNFLLAPSYYFENTAKAVPPNEIQACFTTGKAILCTGQPRPGKIYSRNLYDIDGNFDLNAVPVPLDYPVSNQYKLSTDIQLIRLKDGSLMAIKACATWTELQPKPYWWENRPGGPNGTRGARCLWRSTDCGESWELYSIIDPAIVANGQYGWPSQTDPEMNAGYDRHEIYQDPWTGFIYVSLRARSWEFTETVSIPTLPSVQILHPKFDRGVIFHSMDNGKTWKLFHEFSDAWAPYVMTSTPDGRFFVFHIKGSSPILHYTTAPLVPYLEEIVDPLSVDPAQKTMAEFEIFYTDANGKKYLAAHDTNAHQTRKPPINHPAIARISIDKESSKVRLAYHTLNKYGRQVTAIVNVEVSDYFAPIVTPVAIVEASDPKNYSVVYGTFIQQDFANTDRVDVNNHTVFYWIESSIDPNPVKLSAKYKVFRSEKGTSENGFLSVENGNPRYWDKNWRIGDYMAGGFFWRPKMKELHFLVQWAEPDGVKGNIVAIKP